MASHGLCSDSAGQGSGRRVAGVGVGTTVIACPGLEGTAERVDIPDYNCAEWRNPVIACPG